MRFASERAQREDWFDISREISSYLDSAAKVNTLKIANFKSLKKNHSTGRLQHGNIQMFQEI